MIMIVIKSAGGGISDTFSPALPNYLPSGGLPPQAVKLTLKPIVVSKPVKINIHFRGARSLVKKQNAKNKTQ